LTEFIQHITIVQSTFSPSMEQFMAKHNIPAILAWSSIFSGFVT